MHSVVEKSAGDRKARKKRKTGRPCPLAVIMVLPLLVV